MQDPIGCFTLFSLLSTNIFSVPLLWKLLYKPYENAKLKNKVPKEASSRDKYRSKLQDRVRKIHSC